MIDGNPRFITAAEVAANYAPIGSGGGIGGSIANEQVAFGNGADIAGNDQFAFDQSGNISSLHLGPLTFTWDGDTNTASIIIGSDPIIITGSSLSLGNGQTPRSSAGDIRLQKSCSIKARNNDDSADNDVLSVGVVADNKVVLGDINAEYVQISPDDPDVSIGSSGAINLYPTGAVNISGALSATATVFPDSDPHVAGAGYWLAGVLTKSTG